MRDVLRVSGAKLDDGFLGLVRRALTGTGPALLPLPGDARDEAIRADLQQVSDNVCLVLPTSGSTGRPKLVTLTTEALTASAGAAHDALGGPGRWLLSLPLTHVAGWQVVLRSLLAEQVPAAMPPGPFHASNFAQAAHQSACQYVSLVPTQLMRVLDDPEATAAAASLRGILVGGSATKPALLNRARTAGLRVVRTYGMTETCGGCVYDGRPLPGVTLALEDDGRIRIAGPMLASEYLGLPGLTAERFIMDDGQRWLRTDDLGTFHEGRLRVLGRLDDVIISGGENVAPAVVEAASAAVPGVEDVAVVGVPDPEWGRRVVALVVGTPDEDALREKVRQECGRAAVPRTVWRVGALPMLGIGKLDRKAATMLAEQLEAGEQ